MRQTSACAQVQALKRRVTQGDSRARLLEVLTTVKVKRAATCNLGVCVVSGTGRQQDRCRIIVLPLWAA